MACIHAVLGQPDAALEWLTNAAGNGFPCHAFYERDPLLASIHGDPRFGALMQKLREECSTYSRLYERLQSSA